MRKEHLQAWLPLASPRLRLAAMLAWKTASRWAEVAALTRGNVMSRSPEEVIIDWSCLPKGRRADPYKPSKFTVIEGEWTSDINLLLPMLNDEQPLSEMSTTDLQRQWRSNPMMRRYSGHSFKRGAFRHLINRIVRDSLPIQPHELSVLLKHQLTYDLLSGRTYDTTPTTSIWRGCLGRSA